MGVNEKSGMWKINIGQSSQGVFQRRGTKIWANLTLTIPDKMTINCSISFISSSQKKGPLPLLSPPSAKRKEIERSGEIEEVQGNEKYI